MNDVKLNFINRSNDKNNSEVIIFQMNQSTDSDETAVAWKVIKNCPPGGNHPFEFHPQLEVSADDPWGNVIGQRLPAEYGKSYNVSEDCSGNNLTYSGYASSSNLIEVKNDCNIGSIDAKVYRSGKLLAQKSGICPSQKAVFEFKPTIWIGVASQVEEQDNINSSILEDIKTEINLLGIKSADIVMTGGGPGKYSSPYEFKLENIVYS